MNAQGEEDYLVHQTRRVSLDDETRFLKERSCSMRDRIPTQETSTIRSKAGTFLMGLLEQSQSNKYTTEQTRTSDSNRFRHVTNQRERLRTHESTFFHRLNGPVCELESMTTQVRCYSITQLMERLNREKHNAGTLLLLFQECHRRICAMEEQATQMTLSHQLVVDFGILAVVVSSIRSFRFHIPLQTAAVSLLSMLADINPVYAYMMSELDLDPLIQMAVAVHAGEEQLIMMCSSLHLAMKKAKANTSLIKTYQSAQAEKKKQQQAAFSLTVANEFVTKNDKKSAPRLRKLSTNRTDRKIVRLRRDMDATVGPRPLLTPTFHLNVFTNVSVPEQVARPFTCPQQSYSNHVLSPNRLVHCTSAHPKLSISS